MGVYKAEGGISLSLIAAATRMGERFSEPLLGSGCRAIVARKENGESGNISQHTFSHLSYRINPAAGLLLSIVAVEEAELYIRHRETSRRALRCGRCQPILMDFSDRLAYLDRFLEITSQDINNARYRLSPANVPGVKCCCIEQPATERVEYDFTLLQSSRAVLQAPAFSLPWTPTSHPYRQVQSALASSPRQR